MMKVFAVLLVLALCFLPHRVVACVADYKALRKAIKTSPTTAKIGGADPPVIELCPGTIVFSRRIFFTDRHFALICPEGNTCTLDGGGTKQLFKAGDFETLSSHEVKLQNIDLFGGSTGRGGAIQVYGGTMSLDGCGFVSNTASLGGALYGYSIVHVSITQCSFENNVAYSGDGGALYLEQYAAGTVEIADSTFTSNSAAGAGGAILLGQGSTATITQTTFSGNSANSADNSGDDIGKESGSVQCDDPSNAFCDGYGTNTPKALCGPKAGPGATYDVNCTLP